MSALPAPSDHDLPTSEEQHHGLLQFSESTMGSDVTKPEGRDGDGLANAIVWGSFAVFVLATWTIVLSNDPAKLGWFQYHPLLLSSAIGCFVYGILTLQPTSQPHTKAAGLERHKIFAAGLGLPLAVLGGLAVILQKNSHGAPHFATWHGTFGIITLAWIVVQSLAGGSTVWFNGAAWGGELKAKAMWKYHRLAGYTLFAVLLFTAYLGGTWSNWATAHSGWFVRLLAYSVAPAFILAGVYSRIRPSKMKF